MNETTSNNRIRILRILFLFALAVFYAIAVVQIYVNLLPGSLVGVEEAQARPSLRFSELQSGAYQDRFGRWFSQSFSLRPFLTKLYNQSIYSIFNEGSQNSGVIVGKDGQLFGRDYLNEYVGITPPKSPKELEGIAKDIKDLQELLRKRGVTLTILITPSKPAVYPEYVSDTYLRLKAGRKRNYDYFVPLLQKYGVSYVDGHKICVDKKTDPKYPVFNKGGLHWNDLGAFYTTRQLIKEIEKQTNSDLIDLKCESITVDDKPEGVDRDLAYMLNVIHTPASYITPHAKVVGTARGDEFRPNTLFIGTSFNWQLLEMVGKNNIFSTLDFYYYYSSKTSYPELSSKLTPMKSIDWNGEVFKKDVIVIEVNEDIIPDVGWGFISDCLVRLDPGKYEAVKKTKF